MDLKLPFIIVPALVSLVFKAGIYVYARLSGIHNFQTRLYLFFLFALSIQNVSEIFALYALNIQGTMPTAEATLFYAASIVAFAPLLHLAVFMAFDERKGIWKILPTLFYAWAVVLEVLLFCTPWLISDFQILDYGFGRSVTRVPGPLYFLFTIYSIGVFCGVLGLAIYGARKQTTVQKRLKNTMLMIGITPMALLVVLVLGLLQFGIRLINWSVTFPIAITFFLVVTAYATHQHRIFDIEFFLPWSKVRKRKTAFYGRIRTMVSEIAELGSVNEVVQRLSNTLRCPVLFTSGVRPLFAATGDAAAMGNFPIDELRKIDQIIVADELIDARPGMHKMMKQYGVAAIVPFYPRTQTAASWMLLGKSFSDEVYTPFDFKMVEQLFDRLSEMFLDKLVFMRAQLTEARDQMRSMEERLRKTETGLEELRDENRLLREQNLRLMGENAKLIELRVLSSAAREHIHVATPEATDMKGKSLEEYVSEFEASLLQRTLNRCDGNKSKAARLLGLRPNTLHYKLERYGLSEKKKRE